MRLTWVSGDKEPQQVQYGDRKRQTSEVTTFTQDDMCSELLIPFPIYIYIFIINYLCYICASLWLKLPSGGFFSTICILECMEDTCLSMLVL